jgi:hypothetical protein
VNLTDQEKFKIAELRNDPVYMGILHKAYLEHTMLPPFRPNKDTTRDHKYDLYVFGSGRVQGVQLLLKILGYRNDDRE